MTRICPGCRGVFDDALSFCPEDGLPLIECSPTQVIRQQELQRRAEALGDAPLAVGTLIGEYQLEGVLGGGGMGVIYAGIHPVIRKRVAIGY